MTSRAEMSGPTADEIGASIASFIQAQTIDVAEAALRAEVARGFDNEPVVITDGMPRRDYLQVKPFGTIEFAARPNLAEIVRWAETRLYALSPVGRPPGDPHPGLYRRTHIVMLNGAQVTGNLALALRGLKDGDEVQLVNPQPYARKLEGAKGSARTGRKARRPTSRQAPMGIYRQLVSELVNRYGRVAFFDYKLVRLNLGVQVWGAVGGGRTKVNGKWTTRTPRGRALRDQVYPCVQIKVQAVNGTFVGIDQR